MENLRLSFFKKLGFTTRETGIKWIKTSKKMMKKIIVVTDRIKNFKEEQIKSLEEYILENDESRNEYIEEEKLQRNNQQKLRKEQKLNEERENLKNELREELLREMNKSVYPEELDNFSMDSFENEWKYASLSSDNRVKKLAEMTNKYIRALNKISMILKTIQ